MTVRVTADAVTVGASDEVIAESADPSVDLFPRQPAPVAFDEAVRSSERFPGFDRQGDLRQCFACGADRSPSDVLRIFTGPVDGMNVDGHPLLAGAWVPDAAFGDADGRIRPEFVWAALDCPGGWAIPGPVETGTIWAELRRPIRIGQRTVVAGWHFQVPVARPGSRSRHAAGDVLAVSRATWVVPRDAASLGRSGGSTERGCLINTHFALVLSRSGDERLKQHPDAELKQQRRSEQLFEMHRTLFERLMQFVAERGRLPDEAELDLVQDIREALGGLRRAWRIVERVSGAEGWGRIREERAQDLLIYLALARFRGRPRFTDLPLELRLDLRAFFGTYSRACEEADRLLFSAGDLAAVDKACESSPVGKRTATALYVHASALKNLTVILRIYEGCARSYVGTVEGANIVKLHRRKPQISYLSYPAFDRDGHPALVGALVVPLQTFHVDYRDYLASTNPPILHRKEEFIAADHPLRPRFARLTAQEERAGLYENPEVIGTREGWRAVLDARGVDVRGHRVVRRVQAS